MSALIRKLPKTYYKTKKLVALKDDFEKYIYCKRCASIYKFQELISGVDKSFAKRQIFCKYVAFPNHPHSGKRRPCSYPLFKPYRTPAGQTIFNPKNIFCYKKIKSSLETILTRQGNFEKCQKWRSNINITHCDDLNDFYDGNIWKKFQEVKSLPFLSNSQNFAFMLNIAFSNHLDIPLIQLVPYTFPFKTCLGRKDSNQKIFYWWVLYLGLRNLLHLILSYNH